MDKCTKLTLKDFETPAMYDKIEKITGEVAYKPYQIMIASNTTGFFPVQVL